MNLRRIIVALLPALIFSGIGYALWRSMDPEEPGVDSPLIGRAAPAFEAPLIDGSGVFTEADLRGETPAVLNFFASWCAPCAAEHAELTRIAEAGGARVFGVAFQDSQVNASRFLRRLGDPFVKAVLDEAGDVGDEWGVAKMPDTFILSPSGEVTYRHGAPISAADVEGVFAAQIARAAER